MSIAQVNPVPGIWPMGTMTIANGTPTSILTVVGSQAQGLNDAGLGGLGMDFKAKRPFSSLVAQLTFCAPKANAGEVYVNYGKVAGLDTNATVLIVQPGTTVSLPNGAPLVAGQIDPSQYYLDGATSDKLVVSAVYAN